MSEVLTIEDIKRRYEGEWVLIACSEVDDDLNVIRGEVIAHSPDRDLIYRQLLSKKIQRQRKPLAIEYAGEFPKDLALAL